MKRLTVEFDYDNVVDYDEVLEPAHVDDDLELEAELVDDDLDL